MHPPTTALGEPLSAISGALRDSELIKNRDKDGSCEVVLLSKLVIRPFFYGLVVVSAIDSCPHEKYVAYRKLYAFFDGSCKGLVLFATRKKALLKMILLWTFWQSISLSNEYLSYHYRARRSMKR
ncbi:hypothetical protein JHK87_047558 [Glycine soja]|nr:hypothetical protein JHK87_047558 [Glycine soja]